jgi:hypothetical protein
MRILVWNCKMALSRKRQPLYALGADVAVIPECAKKCVDLCIKEGFDGCWFGDNPNKGLGVLIRKPWRIARIGKACNSGSFLCLWWAVRIIFFWSPSGQH